MHKYLKKLNSDEKLSLKKGYGTGGRAKYWRKLQVGIHAYREEFMPDGLREHVKAEAKIYNEKSFALIRDIEQWLKSRFEAELETVHGSSWFKLGTPEKVYEDAILLAAKKNRDKEDERRSRAVGLFTHYRLQENCFV